MQNVKIILVLLLVSITTYGNVFRPSYLQINTISENNYDVTWRVPVNRKGQKLSLSVSFSKDIIASQKSQGVLVDNAYIQNWRIKTIDGLAGTTVTINGLSTSSTEVLLRFVNLQGITNSAKISPNNPQYTFIKAAGTWATIKAYVKLGIEHILNGFDHLLFVGCLVIIAQTRRKLLWAITGFTLAHSVTLILSALDIVSVPIPPIEASISLSIVFLALEIFKGDKSSLSHKYPIAISASFGLLHGFGFASALKEIGLPETELPAALLSFNLGVEIGQLLFVIFVLICMWLLAKLLNKVVTQNKNTRWIEKPIAYMIGSIAMYWTIDRVSEFF